VIEDVICQESVLTSLYEFAKEYQSQKIRLLQEGMATGLIVGGALVMAIGFKQTLKLIMGLIDFLAKVIRFAIDKFKDLWAWFQTNVICSNADNETLANKASGLTANITITEATTDLTLKGHTLSTNILNIANDIVYNNQRMYNTIYTNLIMDGQSVFKNNDEVLAKIADNRAQILDLKSFPVNATISDFRKVFKNKVFGYGTSSRYSYNVQDAVKILRETQSKLDTLSSLKKNIIDQAENDLKMLEHKKKEFSRARESDIKVTKDFARQMGMLTQYRKQTLDDTLVAFSILLDYTNSSNKIAREICIKAIESKMREG